jgi:hypothetical protein
MSITSLNKISGFDKFVNKYETNKDKKWEDWLVFDRILKPGKQGIVGLFEDEEKQKYVFKMSQHINYLINHEFMIMKSLNDISPYCPHFCKAIGTIECDVNPSYKKSSNPFNTTSKYSIKKKALLCEYVDKSCKFYNYIRSEKISENILFSVIKQVLMALVIAQVKKQFTHYDLHSYNIMMKKCNKDVVFVYVIDKDNQFCIPTYGHYPVIIDFGFSYIGNMDNKHMMTSLAHTNVGFMSDRFDWVSDPKLFLVTVSEEMKRKRKKNKKVRAFRRIVRNIFYPLKIDWESGWDDVDGRGASEYALEILEEYNEVSKLFKDYSHYCIDIIQSLIILPLEKQNYENIGKSYTAFLKEWVKIENQISSPFYNLYILKGMVNAARNAQPYYINGENDKHTVKQFRSDVFEQIDKVSKFCRPKSVNFEVLLCSLLVLAQNVEGVLYNIMEVRMMEKEKEYENLPLKSIEQIYAGIEVNIPSKYVFNKDTTVFIFDSIKEETNVFQPRKEDIDDINEVHHLSRGSFLYDLYNTI